MPSPILHIAAGYFIYQVVRSRSPEEDLGHIGPAPKLLLVTIGLSLLPDLDATAGLLAADFGRFHNNLTHSPFFGIVVGLAVGGLVWLVRRSGFWFWAGLALTCYELHVVMDYLTYGRGAMLAWPFTTERYIPPFVLFYGLHWSDGWVSIRHLWTLMSELGSIVVVWLLFQFLIWGKGLLKRQAGGV